MRRKCAVVRPERARKGRMVVESIVVVGICGGREEVLEMDMRYLRV